jgi:hypothetical protein
MLGLNPDELDVVEIAPKPQAPLPEPRPEVSAKGAFFRELAREFPSTAIGLGTGAALSGPLTPIGGAIAGIAAGLGSRWAQDKAIEGLAPEEFTKAYKESEKQDFEQQGMASTLGRISASLPFLRPSIKGIKDASALVTKPFTKEGVKAITKDEIGAGANMLLGGGIPASIRAMVDPGASGWEILAEGIGGAALNKSWGLGNRIGLHSPTPEAPAPPKPYDPAEDLAKIQQGGNVAERLERNAQKNLKLSQGNGPAPINDLVQNVPLTTWRNVMDIASESVRLGKTPEEAIVEAKAWLTKNFPKTPKVSDEVFDSLVKGNLKQPDLVSPAKPVTDASTPPEAPKDIPETPAWYESIPLLRPEIERLAREGSPDAKIAAQALGDFNEQMATQRGSLVNEIGNKLRKLTGLDKNAYSQLATDPKNYALQDHPDMQAVREYYSALSDGTEVPKLTPNQESVRQTVEEYMQGVRTQQMSREGLRQVEGFTPDYFPDMVAPTVIRQVTQHPDDPETQQLIQDWLNNSIKKGQAKDVEEATKLYDEFIKGFNKKDVDLASQFGPIDKAAGIGLPRSWRNMNLLDSLNRYGDRVSRRFAFYDTIQSKPDIEAAINKYSGRDDAKAVIGQIQGDYRPSNPIISGITGVARSLILGPLSGARDFVSGLALGAQHAANPLQFAKAAVKALTEMEQNIADAWATGRIRHTQSSLAMDLGIDDLATGLRRTRDMLSDMSGRNWLDQMARASAMGQGRLLAIDFHSRLVNGDNSAQTKAWFKNFGKDIDLTKGQLSSEDIKKMAARYVDSVQGTYDYRGLPRQAMEGHLAPVLALSRWSIEKGNNFLKHTITPAIKDGNYVPLLNMTIGSLAGGAAIKGLTEVINNRKDKAPTIAELQEKPQLSGAIYKLAGIVEAAGHTGIIGTALKGILDRTYAKTRPQQIQDVFVQLSSNLAGAVAVASKAIAEGKPVLETLGEAGLQMLEENVQAYRIIANHINSDENAELDAKRDLRTYKLLHDKNVADLSGSFNKPLGEGKLREFKKTDDLEKARELLPELIDEEKKRANGDISEFEKGLNKIKNIANPTMPTPTKGQGEIDFANFYQWLVKTQGKEEADKRVKEWARQKLINQAKTEPLKKR